MTAATGAAATGAAVGAATGVDIKHVNTSLDALVALEQGYEPVECSFGCGDSVLGSLNMDHHGKESWREGVALRAYRDHRSAGLNKFVVTGAADADATFAIAALTGLLPDGLDDLAALVNQVDTNPIGVRVEEHAWGPHLLLWNQLWSRQQDALAFYGGVDRWRWVLKAPKVLLDTTQQMERERVAKAREAKVLATSGKIRLNDFALVESDVWGFDVWYSEIAPCIMAWHDGQVTVGVKDAETADNLFGKGGLKCVFPRLQPQGWGGRETIGGSPRGLQISKAEAQAAFMALSL